MGRSREEISDGEDFTSHRELSAYKSRVEKHSLRTLRQW